MEKIESVVDLERMCTEEGLSKKFVLDNLGIRTLVNAFEKMFTSPESEFAVTSSDSFSEIVLQHLLNSIPDEKRKWFEEFCLESQARDAFFSAEADSITEYTAFAIWIKLIDGVSTVRTALKTATPGTLQEVLAVRKLATFYQK